MKAFIDYLCELTPTKVTNYELVEDTMGAVNNKTIVCKINRITHIQQTQKLNLENFSFPESISIRRKNFTLNEDITLKLLYFRGYKYRQFCSYYISTSFHPRNVPIEWRFI